jgi:hypothetical protein
MAEADPFASSDDLYSITVSGSMNPAIHHPRWYLAARLLNESEVLSAESVPKQQAVDATEPSPGALVCSNVFSQFTFGVLRIVCVQNEWVIMTIERASLDRARQICAQVFEALPHTPVSGYAYNFSFHRETQALDVGKLLAGLAESLPLGLSLRGRAAKGSSASFRYRFSEEGADTTAVVEPSVKDPKKLFVGITDNYQIREAGQFDLGPKLDRTLSRDSAAAVEWLDEILANIERQVGAR